MGNVFESSVMSGLDTIQYLPVSTRPLSTGSRVMLRDGRAFIPIARSGCGVGCKYCYISDPAGEAVPLTRIQMHRLLDDLSAYMGMPGEPRPIMAIGCDTEVGVSPQLTDNALVCLDFAARRGLPVQIATKFPLAPSLRAALEEWPANSAPPVVFTTLTTAALSARIEPNAPHPAERSANFGAHLPTWYSYALIKPFLSTSHEDKEHLLNLLALRRPDGVVVGVRYRRRNDMDNRGDPHPIASDWIATLPSPSARVFVRRLSALGLRVFMNTQCASSWHDPSLDSTIVRDNYPHLCVQCGRCDKEGPVAR